MRIIRILLISISFLTASEFPTEMGDCTLTYVGEDPGTVAELTEIITKNIQMMSESYGPVKIKPFTIDVVNSAAEFDRLTRGYAPEWSIAITQPRAQRIVMLSHRVAKVNYSRFQKVLVHELNHLYLHRIPRFDLAPSWYVEGLAMRETGEMTLSQKIKISQARWQGRLIPLFRLQSMRIHRSVNIDLAYGQSAAAVYAMEHAYGDGIHLDMLDRMRDTASESLNWDELFQQVTGDDLLDFQEKYNTYVRRNYNWMFLLRASNYIFAILPFILIAGYYYKRRKNRLKLALWEVEEELMRLQQEEEQTRN